MINLPKINLPGDPWDTQAAGSLWRQTEAPEGQDLNRLPEMKKMRLREINQVLKVTQRMRKCQSCPHSPGGADLTLLRYPCQGLLQALPPNPLISHPEEWSWARSFLRLS
jgi:hypothetical protein